MFPRTPGLSGGRSHFSGFQVKELALKTHLMFVSVSSADKDAEKTFDSFNRMHMIWRDRIEIESIERLGSDHIHLVENIQQEDIAISECCRGQKPNQYVEDKHADMLTLKTNRKRRLCKCNAV